MAYQKTVWKDRLVQFPRRFTKTLESPGSVTLAPDPGAVTEAGTMVSAAVMQNMEDGIAANDKAISDHLAAADPHSQYALDTDVSGIGGRVTTAENNISGLGNRMDGVESGISTLENTLSSSGFGEGLETNPDNGKLRLYANPQRIGNSARFTEAVTTVYNKMYVLNLAGMMFERYQRMAIVSIKSVANANYTATIFVDLGNNGGFFYIATDATGYLRMGNVAPGGTVTATATTHPGIGMFTGGTAHPIAWGVRWDDDLDQIQINVMNMGGTPNYTINIDAAVVFM